MSHHHHYRNNSHHHYSPCCCKRNTSCSSSSNCGSPISDSFSHSDQLLQALLLLIQSQSSPPPQPSIFLKPQTHHHHHHHHLRTSKPKEDDDSSSSSLLLLHSLTRRVAALESSLSTSPPPSPPKRQTPQQRRQSSLKHAAAATIQRCFRRFLARRSRTLRDLKLLASVKSHSASLRSSLSHTKNPKAISHKAMDLLFRLDSIQGSDPMIREGKRSVSKELVRISEFVDKVLIREKEDEVDVLERRMDRARRVSFAAAEESGDGDVERNPAEEEEVQGFYVPLGGSDDGEESPRVRMSNGGLGLTAPLPVKMEPRRCGSLKKVAFDED